MQRDLASVYNDLRERERSGGHEGLISHGARVSRVENFYQESNLHHFKIYSDEHEEPWGGSNKAPSPLGYLLSAIGFSINNQIQIQSAVAGVKLDSLETVVEGWFDPKGCLDIKGHNPALTKIALQFNVRSSSSNDKVKRVVQKAARCDPTLQTLARAAKVEKKVVLNAKHEGDSTSGGHPGH